MTYATKLPTYLFAREKDYFYNPRGDAVKALVVKRKCFPLTEKKEAIAYATAGNEAIAQWRLEVKEAKKVSGKSKVRDVVAAYFLSPDFVTLAESTREDYKFVLRKVETTALNQRLLANTSIGDITAPMANKMYSVLVFKHGVNNANAFIGILRIVFNWAIRYGYIFHNAFSNVKKMPTKKRKVMWSRQDVMSFLNTSFSKWEWRNMGIVFYMIYEWGQRPSDICKLRWDQIDMEKRKVSIRQSKRGATVHLPISDGLYSILQQQKKDFPSPQLVAPRMRRVDAEWKPYTVSNICTGFNAVKAEAKLAKELQLRDLRRTAITETIENGGDVLTVMMLSGHTSTASLTPYFVHTFKGAQKAQATREFPSDLYVQPLRTKSYADLVHA